MGRKKKLKKKTISTMSKVVVNKKDVDTEKEIEFDYKILNIDKKNENIDAVNFWITASVILLFLIQIFFLFEEANIFANNLYKKIDDKMTLDILFGIGFVGTVLISFDIYDSDKLKSIDKTLQEKIDLYYKSLITSIKYSITITDRSVHENTYWYRNTLFIVIFIYIFFIFEKIYITDFVNSDLVSDLLLSFFVSLFFIQLVLILEDMGPDFLFFDLLFIYFFHYQLEFICSSMSISGSEKTITLFTTYLLIPYLFRALIRNFDYTFVKIFSWIILIVGALPYLLIKLSVRIFPYIFFYPLHLILKSSIYLKANLFLRHLGLVMFIFSGILFKILS